MNKILFSLLLISQISNADVLLPKGEQNAVQAVTCDYVNNYVVKTKTCGDTQVCFGEIICSGSTKTTVSCQAVKGACPSAADCLADETVEFTVANPEVKKDQSGGDAKSKLYNNEVPGKDGKVIGADVAK